VERAEGLPVPMEPAVPVSAGMMPERSGTE
jgi:hypothetical protein